MINIINLEDIPDNLPSGKYTTEVVSASFSDGELEIKLKFIGLPYENHNCLIPFVKEATE